MRPGASIGERSTRTQALEMCSPDGTRPEQVGAARATDLGCVLGKRGGFPMLVRLVSCIQIPTLNTMIGLVQGRAGAVMFFSLPDLIHDRVVSLLASGNQHEWVRMASCYTP
jgi:hypothetical protein